MSKILASSVHAIVLDDSNGATLVRLDEVEDYNSLLLSEMAIEFIMSEHGHNLLEFKLVDPDELEDRDDDPDEEDDGDDHVDPVNEEEQSLTPEEIRLIRGVMDRVLGKGVLEAEEIKSMVKSTDSDEFKAVKDAQGFKGGEDKESHAALIKVVQDAKAKFKTAVDNNKDHLETVQGNRDFTMHTLLGDMEKLLQGGTYDDFVKLQTLVNSLETDLYNLVPNEVRELILTGGKGIRKLSDYYKEVKEQHITEMAQNTYDIKITGKRPDDVDSVKGAKFKIAGRDFKVDTFKDLSGGKFEVTGKLTTRRDTLDDNELRTYSVTVDSSKLYNFVIKLTGKKTEGEDD